MTRRSPEVVDGALGFQHHGSPRDASYVWEALEILADEVRALRLDVAACEASLKRDRHVKDELRRILESNEVVESVESLVENFAARGRTIARVEALPELWRHSLGLGTLVSSGRAGAAVSEVIRECARDLEVRLKGG